MFDFGRQIRVDRWGGRVRGCRTNSSLIDFVRERREARLRILLERVKIRRYTRRRWNLKLFILSMFELTDGQMEISRHFSIFFRVLSIIEAVRIPVGIVFLRWELNVWRVKLFAFLFRRFRLFFIVQSSFQERPQCVQLFRDSKTEIFGRRSWNETKLSRKRSSSLTNFVWAKNRRSFHFLRWKISEEKFVRRRNDFFRLVFLFGPSRRKFSVCETRLSPPTLWNLFSDANCRDLFVFLCSTKVCFAGRSISVNFSRRFSRKNGDFSLLNGSRRSSRDRRGDFGTVSVLERKFALSVRRWFFFWTKILRRANDFSSNFVRSFSRPETFSNRYFPRTNSTKVVSHCSSRFFVVVRCHCPTLILNDCNNSTTNCGIDSSV